jgi:hypothetical protein
MFKQLHSPLSNTNYTSHNSIQFDSFIIFMIIQQPKGQYEQKTETK